MMRFLVFLILAACEVVQPAAASTVENIVARFYPVELTTDPAGDVPMESRQLSFVLGDLDRTGSTLIVAAYCNGTSGAVRVLSPAGNGALIASVIPASMTGQRATIQLIDLDHDGRPEIVATMDQARGLPVAWVYRWTGSSLALARPVSDDLGSQYATSDVTDPIFVDIHGDGTVAVIDHRGSLWYDDAGELHRGSQYRVLEFSAGELRVAGVPDYVGIFERSTGGPVAQQADFTVADAAHSRQFVVINGDADGKSRASSAAITLNGQVIVRPADLSQKVSVVRVPVSLCAGLNTLNVEIRSKPGSLLTVFLITN